MTWTLTGATKCTNGLIILFDLKKTSLQNFSGTSNLSLFFAFSPSSCKKQRVQQQITIILEKASIEFYNNKQGLGRDTFQSLALNVVSLNFFCRIHPWAIRFFFIWYDIDTIFGFSWYDMISIQYFVLRNDLFLVGSCLTTFSLGNFLTTFFKPFFWRIVPK